jgi:hypothetical protein
MSQSNSYFNPKPYIPATLSEINDQLGSMILWAPTFRDRTLTFPDRNIDSEFDKLFGGFGLVRKKLGEERYATLFDLAARAKALFAADQDITNGKTFEGRELLQDMQDILRDVRGRRIKAKLPDEDREISGD